MSKLFFTALFIVLAAGTADAQSADCTPEEPDLPGCQWASRDSLIEQLERSKRMAPKMEKLVSNAFRKAPPPKEPDFSFAYAAEEQSGAELACHTRLPKDPTYAELQRCKEVGRAAAARYLQKARAERRR